jgi:glycosyltransferase involved in cell wall biosynthesis
MENSLLFKLALISAGVSKSPNVVRLSFVFDEAVRLTQRGVDVHIIRNTYEQNHKKFGLNFHGLRGKIDFQFVLFILKNLNVYPLKSFFRNPIRIYWENLYAWNIFKIIQSNNLELIHAHYAYPEGLISLIANKGINKKLIITLHGYDIIKDKETSYGIRLNQKYDYIIKKVLNNADAIITASKSIYNEACQIIKDKDKIFLISNGIDIKKFNMNISGTIIKRKYGIQNKSIIFTLRSHEPKYGVEYFIRSAKIVLEKKQDVVFIIGGRGSLMDYHKKLTNELGLQDSVIFTGLIPDNYKANYYAACDIFVVPSLQEAFGLVASEAMACGKPVIASRVGGLVDQVINEVNGFLVNPKDYKTIAEKILYLLEKPYDARRMGINGRKIVEKKFNIEKRINKILCLYKKLMA